MVGVTEGVGTSVGVLLAAGVGVFAGAVAVVLDSFDGFTVAVWVTALVGLGVDVGLGVFVSVAVASG